LVFEETVWAMRIDTPHRDPVDRGLAAHVVIQELVIVATDGFFAKAGYRNLW
jgi:PIN domain nuclease of toxin-antitoxin system